MRSIGQLLVTTVAFAALWLCMWLSLGYGYWLTLALAVPAAGLLMRLFVIQHDCGHGSFFASRLANDLAGRVIGVVTLTPYGYWRRAHAQHHATSGNLDRRGIGDITTMTVGEYAGLSRWRRLAYRIYRHPLVLFGIGPSYIFLVKHRLNFELPLFRRGIWISLLASNVAIIGVFVVMAILTGVQDLIMIQVPITMIASSMGVWLFFVQHQIEHAYWRREDQWSYHDAALSGSSYYDLPRILRWFTADIGLHHVHHLCSRIPNYRLQECMDRIPELQEATRMTLAQSLKCARLALWDEDAGRMITFQDLKIGRSRSRP